MLNEDWPIISDFVWSSIAKRTEKQLEDQIVVRIIYVVLISM